MPPFAHPSTSSSHIFWVILWHVDAFCIFHDETILCFCFPFSDQTQFYIFLALKAERTCQMMAQGVRMHYLFLHFYKDASENYTFSGKITYICVFS